MMKKILAFINTSPAFLFLLSAFFIFHGYTENFEIEIGKESATLFLIYIGASFVIAFISWLFYKNIRKAFLFAFCLMTFNFFFGSVHDFLKAHFEGAFFVKYIFILPATFIFFLSLFIWLNKTNRTFTRTTTYLNWVLLLLIIVDAVGLGNKIINPRQKISVHSPASFTPCDTCSRPDIYLIIADEYAGHQELQDIFHYDNTPFENELQNRGFHVLKNTKSNYNATAYSMASMLNMGYLEDIKSITINQDDMFRCKRIIENNFLTKFLKFNGYEILNFSFFDVGNSKKLVSTSFFVSKASVLASQTFINRIFKDIGYHFAKQEELDKIMEQHLKNNRTIEKSLLNSLSKNSIHPRFTYTHFTMPHHPYYLDSTGFEYSTSQLTEAFKINKDAYISYLKFTNKTLLKTIDEIKKCNLVPPIIILMSDHGFRQLDESIDHKYHFINLNAVFLPDGNYSAFYDGMSNVNQFRVLLNSRFAQHLPLLKDSTIFLWE